jgi:hypothetical protein
MYKNGAYSYPLRVAIAAASSGSSLPGYGPASGYAGGYPMLSGAYGYPMLSGAYPMNYGASTYGSYPTSGGGPPYSVSTTASSQGAAAPAETVEVSGPLDVPPPRRGVIRLRLPREWADVYVNGQKIDAMGKSRTYVTPELPQARTFKIAAVWKDKAGPARVEGTVTVAAGQIRTLDLASGR